MEKVNIVEILKDAPEGLKLWSDIYGVVEFKRVRDGESYPINFAYCNGKWENCATETGANFLVDDEDILPCTLWPSEDHRSWKDGFEDLLLTQDASIGKYVKDNEGFLWLRVLDGFKKVGKDGKIVFLPLCGLYHFCYNGARYCSLTEALPSISWFGECGYVYDGKIKDLKYLPESERPENSTCEKFSSKKTTDIDEWIKKTVTELSGQNDILSSDRFLKGAYETGARDVLNMIKDKLKID